MAPTNRKRPPDMTTIDDQLRALAPLKPGLVAELAGYDAEAHPLRAYRARGSIIPAERLRAVARRLRELADVADSLTAPTTRR